MLARLIRLLGVERGEPDKAAEVLKQVEAVVKESRPDDDGRKAYRQAIIASGDALLWANKPASARSREWLRPARRSWADTASRDRPCARRTTLISATTDRSSAVAARTDVAPAVCAGAWADAVPCAVG